MFTSPVCYPLPLRTICSVQAQTGLPTAGGGEPMKQQFPRVHCNPASRINQRQEAEVKTWKRKEALNNAGSSSEQYTAPHINMAVSICPTWPPLSGHHILLATMFQGVEQWMKFYCPLCQLLIFHPNGQMLKYGRTNIVEESFYQLTITYCLCSNHLIDGYAGASPKKAFCLLCGDSYNVKVDLPHSFIFVAYYC